MPFPLYGSLYTTSTIDKFNKSGVADIWLITPAGTLVNPEGIAFDTKGNLYVANFGAPTVYKISPSGKSTLFATITGTSTPALSGLTFDAAGNLYVADYINSAILKVTPKGVVSTYFAGTPLDNPQQIVFDSVGNLYVANNAGNVVQIQPGGSPAYVLNTGTFAFATPFGLAFDVLGNLYVSDATTNTITKLLNVGGSNAGTATYRVVGFYANNAVPALSAPHGLTFDTEGNLFVANPGAVPGTGNIIKITPKGGSVFSSSDSLPAGGNEFLAFTLAETRLSCDNAEKIVKYVKKNGIPRRPYDPKFIRFMDGIELSISHSRGKTNVTGARRITLKTDKCKACYAELLKNQNLIRKAFDYANPFAVFEVEHDRD